MCRQVALIHRIPRTYLTLNSACFSKSEYIKYKHRLPERKLLFNKCLKKKHNKRQTGDNVFRCLTEQKMENAVKHTPKPGKHVQVSRDVLIITGGDYSEVVDSQGCVISACQVVSLGTTVPWSYTAHLTPSRASCTCFFPSYVALSSHIRCHATRLNVSRLLISLTYADTYTVRAHIQVRVFEWENPQAGSHCVLPLVSSSFEVDADSWMLGEPCAPLAEETAQRNINGLRLDVATQAHTLTVNTGSLRFKDGKGQRRRGFPAEQKKPETESVNKNHTSRRY